jgi:HPt (histidine-containing phosphotransfer) domain-containing protein
MDEYVSKPIKTSELFEAIETLMRRRYEADERDGSAAEVIDRQEALAQVEGDVELLVELAEAFLEDYPRLLAEIDEALAGRDSAALADAAHALKGSIGYFGSRAAYRAAERLETLASASRLDGWADAYEELTARLEQLKTALLALSKTPSPCVA